MRTDKKEKALKSKDSKVDLGERSIEAKKEERKKIKTIVKGNTIEKRAAPILK